MRYFRVKYGFNPSDQVSIEEKDIEKAIIARKKGIPVQLGNAFISGSNIISITPHWHKHTGWYEWYEPKNGEDEEQIKRDCPNYDGVIEAHNNRVIHLIQTNQEKALELPAPMFEELDDKFKLKSGFIKDLLKNYPQDK